MFNVSVLALSIYDLFNVKMTIETEAAICTLNSTRQLHAQALVDFSGDVSMVRAIHETAGTGSQGLHEHADALRQIGGRLVDRIAERGSGVKANSVWPTVVDLALSGGEEGAELMDSYSYFRVNKLLDAEFGPAETSTTQLLRKITLAETELIVQKSPHEEVKRFFDTYFADFIFRKIFGSHGSGANPEIEKHVLLEAEFGEVKDPALARLISTMLAKSCEVVFEIDLKIRTELLQQNSFIFTDRGMRTRAPKEKTVLWSEMTYDTSGTEALEERLDDTSGHLPDESDDDDVLVNDSKLSFDRTLAACRIERTQVDNREQYELEKGHFLSLMFPLRGQDVVAAKSVCAGCCVKDDCLEFALANKIHHGIWGGTSVRGRIRIMKDRQAQAIQQA